MLSCRLQALSLVLRSLQINLKEKNLEFSLIEKNTMACPYFAGKNRPSSIQSQALESRQSIDASHSHHNNGINNETPLSYKTYLKIPQLLSAQSLLSSEGGKVTPVHDEHLFIITHQAFELWFKQIIFDIESVIKTFDCEYLEERNTLCIIQRLDRVSQIVKLLCDQFPIIETMTPQDFLEMRVYLGNSSGFESMQFRLLEIKLGVCDELRILYNKVHYTDVFFGEEKDKIFKARTEKSLLDVVNNWLERTPGLEANGFDFFGKYKSAVNGMIEQNKAHAEACEDLDKKQVLLEECQSQVDTFATLFDENLHNELRAKGNRRLTHKATLGALFIYLYREEPRIHLPFQILQRLMDIDSAMLKFRYNHACMVQRMIGSKIGTGGSSGYMYLRSTCGDRYRVFLDLMNLSTYLITRDRIPPLSAKYKHGMSIHDWMDNLSSSENDVDEESGIHSVSSHPSLAAKFKKATSLSGQLILDENVNHYRHAGKPETEV
ncbi:tryptophan 2,3-dioxygenase-like isoform X2 [Clavelina lepadiformis]|uniref:tryptophan 2,3-dioxygenase-like isoform X2 n=1 Tax=Clavelina lepadiformis TaxID=159417 RepID=UPI004042DACE